MTTTPPAVTCRGLSVSYGDVPALTDVDLEVGRGQVLALLGASGSGKTTLLHTLAGFIRPSAGEVRMAGEVVAGPQSWVAPEHREVGLVFQGAALWPHLNVLDTVAYPIRRRGSSRTAARASALVLLERVGLTALAERLPAELSGGEQQRVGLARALARDPALFLFDEPTAHLDPHLRGVVLEEIARRRQALGAAAVYATHDATEALAVADRVAVLAAGKVVQVGTPEQVYECPVDLDVARLTDRSLWWNQICSMAQPRPGRLYSSAPTGSPSVEMCPGSSSTSDTEDHTPTTPWTWPEARCWSAKPGEAAGSRAPPWVSRSTAPGPWDTDELSWTHLT